LFVARPNSPGWSWRLYPALALLFFVLHASLLWAARHTSVLPLLSNLVMFALGAVAAGAAWQATRKSTGFAKVFWRLQAAGLLLWTAAQGIATVYDSILHKPLDQPWPSDILFFVWMTPAFLSLFLDANSDSEKIEWQQWLDFAQVVILIASLYVFEFEVPAHWQRRGISLEELALMVGNCRNVLLVASFALRASSARKATARGLYGRMAIFFFVYSVVEGSYLYLQVFDRLRPGTVWDLPWSFAFVAGTFLIATWRPNVEEEQRLESAAVKPAVQRPRVLLKLVPLIFPLAVLLMAANIAEAQFTLAIAAVLASFACFGARILLGERQQRASAQALEESNALLKAVFEGTGDAIYVKNMDGRYVIGNRVALRFLGKTLEQMSGKNAGDLFESEVARQIEASDLQLLESGNAQSFELQLTREERVRTYLLGRNAFLDAHGKIAGIITVARDITEYRVMEERLRQSQKMEAIGTLAGGVAHDFNNILMVISGYGSVLNDALATDPKLRGHVEQIQKAGERAASLTRQLLAFSRKQTIQPVALSLNQVVTGIESLLHRLIGENINITTKFANDLGTVLADAGQIEQVILNLAVNARDAMPEGGTLTLETMNAEIGESNRGTSNPIKPGRYVELKVADTGVGIEPGIRTHIFEPFFTTKPTGKGTGLGLSTVYGIVQQAGGHVTFLSAPGAGATFRVLLPRIDSLAQTAAHTDHQNSGLRGMETVLLVEDDDSVCDLVRDALAGHGYSVISARRPEEAETLSEKHSGTIDLLLTDVIMPGMSGTELSRRITARNPQMKVLFMSGYNDDSVVRQGVRENEVAFLQKPFSPVSLARKVREVLDAASVR
jgi:two-component system, cell cycle sensor histidine kinase and response regulator CckA